MTTGTNVVNNDAINRVALPRLVASGRREGWYKLVMGVDNRYTDGYTFIGDFLTPDVDHNLPVGGFLVRKVPTGSAKNNVDHFHWGEIPAQGEAIVWSEPYLRDHFLSFRDDVRGLLGLDDMPNNTHRLRLPRLVASGRREGWYKEVTDVDQSKTNGYAFGGRFIPADQEIDLEIGTIIVRNRAKGSGKNHIDAFSWALVPPPGQKLVWSEDYERKVFLTFRDMVAVRLKNKFSL